MDLKETKSPGMPGMLNDASIDNAEKNEFNNNARDIIKLIVNNYYNSKKKEGENPVLENSDVIEFLRIIVPLFLAEVRKNDQSRSTIGEAISEDGNNPVPQAVTSDHTLEGDPVNIMDIVPDEPSSLPIVSVADRYTRSMLACLLGYPLYEPQPFSELEEVYSRIGVNVGDVGYIRGDGTFDFLFNICPARNSLINPTSLPNGFCLKKPSVVRDMRPLPTGTCVFQNPVTRTKSGEYICETSEGAALELPEGAFQVVEATQLRPFSKLAANHGVQWYEYAISRGRDIPNGALYLITSFIKCSQWGIAVFDRPCAPGDGLKFDKKFSLPFGKSTSKYSWVGPGSRACPTKVSSVVEEDYPNQCVFVRGYKVMIRTDLFNNLCNDSDHSPISNPAVLSEPSLPKAGGSNYNMTRQPATRIRGGGGTEYTLPGLTGGGPSTQTTSSELDELIFGEANEYLLIDFPLFSKEDLEQNDPFSPDDPMLHIEDYMMGSEEVVLYADFNSSIVHPSDFINASLLSQNPGASVALTHDDVWCDLLRDNFPKFNFATLINIALSYTCIVDEYDCVSLEKISDPSNVSEPNTHDGDDFPWDSEASKHGTHVKETKLRDADPKTVSGRRRKKDVLYKCPFQRVGCKATFTTRYNLKYHINCHEGLKPYKCNLCSYAAASPTTLKRHMFKCRSAHLEDIGKAVPPVGLLQT